MVFKVVRIDSTQPYKVPLSIGKHIIGRGKFLVGSSDDNRVSREHAELAVTDDLVMLKSLHINPCFLIKKDTNQTVKISQNSTISLNCGDKFGLLPESYWFELIYIEDDNQCEGDEIVENKADQVQTNDYTSENGQDLTTTDACTTTPNISTNGDLDENAENGDSPESQSLLTQEFDHTAVPSSSTDIESNSSLTPVKRVHSSQELPLNDEAKKIKTEPGTEDINAAGPSNEQEVKPKVADDGSNQSPAQAPTKRPLRERCMYGANCYRRNPQHKVEFSHPHDPDWDESDRRCPYGADCRRRRPRHWQDYTHPPGVNPPDPNRPGMRVVQRHGNVFYINAATVNFYDDHFQAVDSDGSSADYDYEF